MNDLGERLARNPFVAILRGVRPDEVESIAEALLAEGVEILEVPLNSPQPLDSIERLAKRFGGRALVGAGTVLDAASADAVARAGARIAVMPNADAEVVRASKAAGMIAMPGFLTPSEAFAMLAAGADALKLFPAEASSPGVLQAMRAVLPPGTGVLPVGGVRPDNLGPWLAAGAVGFGIGSAIYKPGSTPEAVRERARAFNEALRAVPRKLSV
ncbi:2-dehydro-3-deoxy-6-phosphogalactonate aldolase [Usitatibacter rugosus]|uniref:2-dehydro-3-deoxy-6-phosphogalactonate aldolase n=1 Tax=Usitatibacter rugosus TaxID=2732067 RepID=A0A6M4GRA7_9PROT|nr:2-dehydro-3-deoxy-6-phosphogalactonate aldolase [Usitatibacter rugosus]QJR09616.1 2-dehydro-3-deoxy-6-phosphogalactonate aldolase [Usitatibacter rugosus]